MEQRGEPKVKSLYKALKLLEYFDEEHKEIGVTELAEYSGMLKSSVHNILQTFEQCGYVKQNVETNKYTLGGAVVSLFSKYKQTKKVDYRITEYLQHLRDEFKTNVYFGVKEQDFVVYLCSEQAFYFQKDYLSKEGAKVPLHCTGLGKILLGFSTAEEKQRFYEKELEAYTKNTITDTAVLKKELEEVVYRGYALTSGEYREGVYCLAVPVIVGNEMVRYAIGIASMEPLSGYMMKEYLRETRDIAKKIAGILSV